MLEIKAIEPGEWGSPVVLIPKDDATSQQFKRVLAGAIIRTGQRGFNIYYP